MDARTTGEDGLHYFERITAEADRQGISCGGILLLSADQADWPARVKQRPTTVVLTDQPEQKVTMKQLVRSIHDLVPPPVKPG